MSNYLEQIKLYFRKGLYNKAHLEMLERRGHRGFRCPLPP